MKKLIIGTMGASTEPVDAAAIPEGKAADRVRIVFENATSSAIDVLVTFTRRGSGGILGGLRIPGNGVKNFGLYHPLIGGDTLSFKKTDPGVVKYSISYTELDNTRPAPTTDRSADALEQIAGAIGSPEAAASADLLTKLDELKTAVDGFEPVRVVLPPAVAGANLEADVVTAETPLTAAYQDLATVVITPQSDVADMRIWLTLFWQGRMTYRVVRDSDEVVSEQSVDSTSGTLPVSYPVAHSPASTAAQTYKLQAKRAESNTSASAQAGTTLYVEEIYGG